jgi:hypothetical protein
MYYFFAVVNEETVLQGMIDTLIEVGKYFGMEMNVGKPKLMRISSNPPTYRL